MAEKRRPITLDSAAVPPRTPLLTRLLGWGAAPLLGTPTQRAHHVESLFRTLLSERGEVSGARVAIQATEALRHLDLEAWNVLFDHLARGFSPVAATIAARSRAYIADPTEQNLVELQRATESPRQELFRRINMAPDGTGALLDLRRRLLATLSAHPERLGVDADLLHLFRSWFNRGFLDLRRIDWHASAYVLERLIQYEAVHQIQGWDDLRRRLQQDRRCYAFFHPALADEPLIFVEVALTRAIPGTVQPLLDPQAPIGDPRRATTAVFYSITNCQLGLRGVSFGNLLIKQVVEDLGREFPRLRFATLSPIPGFVDWLSTLERRRLSPDLSSLLHAVRATPAPLPAIPAALRDEITRWCAHYLIAAKQGTLPADPVARFHLANGARLHRLNWLGDISATGMTRSLGMTANYVYRLAEVETNHEAYASQHRVIAARSLTQLASAAPAPSNSPVEDAAAAARTTG